MAERVRIKPLKAFDEFEKLLEIQRAVWSHSETDLTPVHQFAVSSRMGAILLGAYKGNRLSGFVYSFPAVFRGNWCQHSHLLAVLPEFRGSGLGKALKLAQRDEALRRGYDLITWTFDPLQTRNANLNLQALSAVARTYAANFYGLTPALCLGPGIPTDRLLIEWPIRSPRVRARVGGAGRTSRLDPDRLPRALERKAGREGIFAPPGRPRFDLEGRALLVEVPRDVRALAPRFDLIADWQRGLRRVMTSYFGRGWVSDRFVFGERCFYVLRRPVGRE